MNIPFQLTFFASVEQQCDKRLRGRPIGVVPFEGTNRTAVIACSKEAKTVGVKNVMPVKDALRVCPDLIIVPQKPDLYRRAHNALLCEIETVIAIDTAKSIDELTCVLDDNGKREPELLSARIEAAIADNIGPYITSSIGFTANRQLAKIACKAGKDESNVMAAMATGLRSGILHRCQHLYSKSNWKTVRVLDRAWRNGFIKTASTQQNSSTHCNRSICARSGRM